jgi:hypothetical protein
MHFSFRETEIISLPIEACEAGYTRSGPRGSGGISTLSLGKRRERVPTDDARVQGTLCSYSII